MDDKEFIERLQAGVGAEELQELRRATGITVGEEFRRIADALRMAVDKQHTDFKQITAVYLLLEMAGELTTASTQLLSSGQHYAGAALLRQIVEIEYLIWTFQAGARSPEAWLDSTHEERIRDFSPARLRTASHGRFLTKDYQFHCEQGGHPVPFGAHLLFGQNAEGAQVFVVDLLMHTWRIWDFVQRWAIRVAAIKSLVSTAYGKVTDVLAHWGELDPVYALSVERYPVT